MLRIEGVWAEPGAPADSGRASGTPSTASRDGSGRSRSTSGGPCRAPGRRRCGHSSGHARGRAGAWLKPGASPLPCPHGLRDARDPRRPGARPGDRLGRADHQTSTFAQEAVGVHKGYDYARVSNPTRTALEECLASLENAAHGHAFSSGLGATTSIMHLLDPGDHVVCVNDVYGDVPDVLAGVRAEGLSLHVRDAPGVPDADSLVGDARLVWIETPTNPLLNLVDIAAVARATKAAGALLVVDNTFATPYLQRPLDLGADIVLHSTTKYLGGHSDVIGGFPRRTTRRSPSACASSRSRSAPSRARSTRGSSCAA